MALFGQWDSAMLTLALIAISVPLCIGGGLALGILAYRKPWIDRLIIEPSLDLMRTMPTFAYLDSHAAAVRHEPRVGHARDHHHSPCRPMVRATVLALKRVPHEIDDFGEMVGCTQRQKLLKVLLPTTAGRCSWSASIRSSCSRSTW